MRERRFETSRAFAELVDAVREAEQSFVEGARAVDDVSVLEGYRWLTEILSVALECYLWADSERPSIVPIAGPCTPTRKWGGDNSDSHYYFAPIDGSRRYLLRGKRGDSCYTSITVYAGPKDGRWSTRIVGTLNDRAIDFEPDGSFEVVLSAELPDPPVKNWMKLEEDSEALITRDYLVHPLADRATTWEIRSLDPAPPPRLNDADLAERFRRATNFLRDLNNINPIRLEESLANVINEPFPTPRVTYGWGAGDAAYAMGGFDLAPGQALVIEGRSPRCVFWNLCLWNPYMQTYDYRYERVTINGGEVQYEPDGSWRIVVADEDPGVPNWVSTAGHPKGLIWIRWFLAEAVPERPTTRVARLDELAR